MHGHARAGRDARRVRRPHRCAGLDADAAPRRPGAARECSVARPSRSSTIAACSAGWPSGSSRWSPRTTCPALSRAPSTSRPRAARARSCSRCRRTCWPRSPTRPTLRRTSPARPRRRRRSSTRLRTLLAAASRPLLIVGEGGWSAAAADDVLAFAESSLVPVAASFRCQDYVDNRSSVYCGHLTIGPDPSARPAGAAGRPDRRARRPARRHHDERVHAARRPASRGRRWYASIPTRTSSRRSTSPHSRSSRVCPRRPQRFARSSRYTILAGRRGPPPPEPTTSTTSATRRFPATSTWAT